MNMQRTIEIRIDVPDLVALQNLVGYEAFSNAIGYLSLWNLNFPRAYIYLADKKDGELQACFERPEGGIGYVIGAIFREGKYEFHS